MYDYLSESQNHTSVIGSFTIDRDQDFKDGVKQLVEGFRGAMRIDPIDDLIKVLKADTLKESYKEQLLGDVLNESFDDPYYDLLPQKMEQLFENSTYELVREAAGIGQMSPIVGVTPPILKKNFLECHSKDIVMTEVPSKPIIKVDFERKFLKDREGNKYYIPEIFYDDSYREVAGKARGKAITSDWFNKTGVKSEDDETHETEGIRIQDLDILGKSGGSLTTRDSLAYDFCIEAVRIVVNNQVQEVTGLDIKPDLGAQSTISYRIKHTHDSHTVEDIIVGQVDQYHGTVSVTSTAGKVVAVRFGGHLSNENNIETIELDRERERKDWMIPDGHRINTGLTIEKIKDYKALLDIDVTAEVIADMSTVLTQFEDSDILHFLDTSLNTWKNKKELPFGYAEGFVETGRFSCEPPSGVFATTSMWINSELKFTLNRLIDELKDKLKTKEVMFVVYAHPNNISLLQEDVNWIVDEGTKIGGCELDYRFGVMTQNQTRIHVVSSLKVDKKKGLRVVAYPTTKDTITFKHYKYSLNIENVYRNPLTPSVPNVMGTSRYLTTEVLPIQGQLELTNNGFGIASHV